MLFLLPIVWCTLLRLCGSEIDFDSSPTFPAMEAVLLQMTGGAFPLQTTVIAIESSKHIFAPRYLLYQETTEAQQIENAKRAYGLLVGRI